MQLLSCEHVCIVGCLHNRNVDKRTTFKPHAEQLIAASCGRQEYFSGDRKEKCITCRFLVEI